MQRHVRKHRLHQRLVGQVFLEHTTVSRVVQRVRKPGAH